MGDFGEAIGTAVEGGLFARTVSGSADGSGAKLEKGHFAEGSCLNCGTVLTGPHCHQCGQKAHLHRTLGAFMHDLLHGALHFDGKTWRTLPKLIFRPGELTRRYIEGERARFVSPMALFLFSIFLMFAVFQFAGISAPTDFRTNSNEELRELAGEQVARLEARRETLAERAADSDIDEAERERAARDLAEIEDQLEAITVAREELPFLQVRDGEEPAAEPAIEGEVSIPITGKGGARVPVSATPDEDWRVNLEKIGWLQNAVEKWQSNPGLMLYKLQTNFYKFSWLLIPLSIPFVWLMFFWKRRFRAYDHAIFVTYSLAFMTMLILAIVLAGMAGLHPALVTFASILIPPLHIYKQLRGAYALSRFSALWRLGVLTVFIMIIFALFTSLLLMLGLF